MALDMTADQKQLGRDNFQAESLNLAHNRRDFMKGLLAGGLVAPVAAATYYGYSRAQGAPVKAAIIGCGDEGGVLVGQHNPDYLQIVAACDLRPSNLKRIFTGDPKAKAIRKGFNAHYGNDANKTIRTYDNYRKMLEEEKEIEAVIIATPLISHAPIAIDCLNAKKHVLCEKLMAWNITLCKDMIKAAKDNDRILSVGHQRHYSMLYAHATEVLGAGTLGDIKHIRALWHRNNSFPAYTGENKPVIDQISGKALLKDGWYPEIPDEDMKLTEEFVRKNGYKNLNELVRWRLFNRTGNGLMAELGSHQMDAASIFLGKVHPIAVSGVGGKFFYGPGKNDRESDDHVFVTYEFPGKNYANNKDDIVVVTYSSINTNSFEPYGECVMGTRGTMVVEAEQSVMLYKERDPNAGKAGGPPRSTAITVDKAAAGKPAVDAYSSVGGPAVASGSGTAGATPAAGPISRGYTEEMEDFAYCIKMWNQGMSSDRRTVRCDGEHAMADAIVALTANLAMKHHQRIEFKPSWFDPASPEVPDAEMKPEYITG